MCVCVCADDYNNVIPYFESSTTVSKKDSRCSLPLIKFFSS
jgi:hypothetical protein